MTDSSVIAQRSTALSMEAWVARQLSSELTDVAMKRWDKRRTIEGRKDQQEKGERKRMKKSSDREMKDGLSVMEGIKIKKLKTEGSKGAMETTVGGGVQQTLRCRENLYNVA